MYMYIYMYIQHCPDTRCKEFAFQTRLMHGLKPFNFLINAVETRVKRGVNESQIRSK